MQPANDWEAPKLMIKPPDQVDGLTEKALDEDINCFIDASGAWPCRPARRCRRPPTLPAAAGAAAAPAAARRRPRRPLNRRRAVLLADPEPPRQPHEVHAQGPRLLEAADWGALRTTTRVHFERDGYKMHTKSEEAEKEIDAQKDASGAVDEGAGGARAAAAWRRGEGDDTAARAPQPGVQLQLVGPR